MFSDAASTGIVRQQLHAGGCQAQRNTICSALQRLKHKSWQNISSIWQLLSAGQPAAAAATDNVRQQLNAGWRQAQRHTIRSTLQHVKHKPQHVFGYPTFGDGQSPPAVFEAA
jgi:hypothetical protein